MSALEGHYMLSRNLNASSRLTAQHLLLCRRSGALLDSRILNNDRQELTIADIGCGNGIWAIEVSQSVVGQVIGLDVSPELFPPHDIWPSTCTFDTFNVLDPVVRKYVGAFDIVNVRLLAGGLCHQDSDRVLENLRLMLKEGGWLQWLDIAPPYILTCEGQASHGLPISISCELPRVITSLGWIGHLPDLLTMVGFTHVESSKTQPQGALLKHETSNVLLALSEIRDHLAHYEGEVDGFEQAFKEVYDFVARGGLVAVALRTTVAQKTFDVKEKLNEIA